MAERKKGMSRREFWAMKTGQTKEQYKASEEGRAVSKIKKYYEEESDIAKKEKKTTIKRLKEDLETVLGRIGVLKNRATQEYLDNMADLKQNKEVAIEDLNYYTRTQTERTAEDATTNLRRETQRFDLEQYKLNQSLASKNLVFSGMKGVRGREQGLIDTEHKEEVTGIETTKKRSFQDIQRYEFAQNRKIAIEFERGTRDTEKTKTSELEDLGYKELENKTDVTRGIENAKTSENLLQRDLDYARSGDISGIELAYDKARQSTRQMNQSYGV